jgi:hypothetical protein
MPIRSESPALTCRVISSASTSFKAHAYAYRAGRNAQQAVIDVEETLFRDHPEVVDADLADYFGSIPHVELMRSLALCGGCCIDQGPPLGSPSPVTSPGCQLSRIADSL